MLDNARHDDIHQMAQDLAGIAYCFMAAELYHARSEVLRMASELLHRGLEGYPRPCGGLLEYHAERLMLHKRRIVAGLDAFLYLKRKLDNIQYLLFRQVLRIDKMSYSVCIHI